MESSNKKIFFSVLVAIIADFPSSCVDCESYRDQISRLETNLNQIKGKIEEDKEKLDSTKNTLSMVKEKEHQLRLVNPVNKPI